MSLMTKFERTVATHMKNGKDPYVGMHEDAGCPRVVVSAALGRLQSKGYTKRVYKKDGVFWEITHEGRRAVDLEP